MKALKYKYYMWQANRADDFRLMWYYEYKAKKILNNK